MKESIPILTILIFVGCIGGQILNTQMGYLAIISILLLLTPLINGVGGNIGSILSARISSGLHVGYIEPKMRGKVLRENIITSLILGLITFTIFGAIIGGVAFLVGRWGIHPLLLALIIIVTGLITVCTAIILSVIVSIISFKRGVDPDNIVIPILTTVIDVLGICYLIGMIRLVGII